MRIPSSLKNSRPGMINQVKTSYSVCFAYIDGPPPDAQNALPAKMTDY